MAQVAVETGDLLDTLASVPTGRRQLVVIANPYATRMTEHHQRMAIDALRARYAVRAIETVRPEHAIALAREAAATGVDAVVAFGGDGTVNECVNGLVGTDVPLAILPGGTTNVLAKMVGIPGNLLDATEHLMARADDWQTRTIDLGEVNGRSFTFTAGIGLDAAVTGAVDARPDLKHRFKAWYFIYRAVTIAARDYLWHPHHFEVTADGQTVRALTAIVQNGEHFTYLGDRPIGLATTADLSSGTLAAVAVHRASLLDIPTVAARLLSSRTDVVGHRQITPLSAATEVNIRSMKPVPVQVDGDYIGDVTNATFRVSPGALRVIA